MDNEPEVIRQRMEETRSSLSDKLEALEQHLTGTVEGAAAAVADTVESVKDVVQTSVETVKGTVQDTVDTVKDTFDLRRQVDQHPWAMLGGSVALGYLAGRLLGRSDADRPRVAEGGPARASMFSHWPTAEHNGGLRGHTAPPASAPEPPEPGLFSVVAEKFGPELAQLKGLALGTLFGVVRDLITQALPEQMKPHLTDVMNGITTKMGGEPIHGSVLPSCPVEKGPSQEAWEATEMGRPMAAAHR